MSKKTDAAPAVYAVLTQQMYYESRDPRIQRAMNYNNLQKRITAFIPLVPILTVNRAIDINGADAYFVMENLAQTGFTSIPKEGDIIPWQMQPPPVNKILCSEPLSPIPGVPTYEDYIAEHGPFPIKVSVDPADYPKVANGFQPLQWAEFLQLKTDLSKQVQNFIGLAPLNEEHFNLLPDGVDDVDVQTVEVSDGAFFPQLADMRLAYKPGVSRFALVLNLKGPGSGGPLAYWADDVRDAFEKDGPEGVLALGAGR